MEEKRSVLTEEVQTFINELDRYIQLIRAFLKPRNIRFVSILKSNFHDFLAYNV